MDENILLTKHNCVEQGFTHKFNYLLGIIKLHLNCIVYNFGGEGKTYESRGYNRKINQFNKNLLRLYKMLTVPNTLYNICLKY